MLRTIPDPRDFLDELPRRRRNAVLAYVNIIQSEDLEDLAIFLKFKRPETTDGQIATICGVSRSTVARWERYQAAKPKREDYQHTQRRPSKWRASNDGGRWPLDHPGGV